MMKRERENPNARMGFMARQTTTRRKKGAADEAPPAEAGAASGTAQDSAELRRRIERRAYEIWEREGRPSGQEAEHWRRAEAELAAEAGGSGTAAAAAQRPRAAAKRATEPGEAASAPASRRGRQKTG